MGISVGANRPNFQHVESNKGQTVNDNTTSNLNNRRSFVFFMDDFSNPEHGRDINTIGAMSTLSYDHTDFSDAVSRYSNIHIVTDETGKATTKSEGLDELRKNGISKQVDWKRLDKDLSLISQYTGVKNSISADVMSKYLASTYSTLKNQIKNDYSGEEMESQLKELDTVMNSHIESFANSLADNVGTFYDENGMSGQREKIYASTKENVEELTKAYDDHIAQNNDFANVKGTQDEWLSRAHDYMSSQLRDAVDADSVSTKNGGSDKYSINEIKEMSDAASLFKNELLNSEYVRTGISEEELGVRLGTMAVKGLAYIDTTEMSEEAKSALSNALNKKISELIDETDNLLEEWRNSPMIKSDVRGFAALDKGSVFKVINTMKQAYGKTKNVSASLMEGMMQADKQYAEKTNQHRDVYRYRNSDFFSNLFSSSGEQKNKSNGYINTKPISVRIGESVRDFFQYSAHKDVLLTTKNFEARA